MISDIERFEAEFGGTLLVVRIQDFKGEPIMKTEIATSLLARCFFHALGRAGLEPLVYGAIGPFENCDIAIPVSDVEVASKLILEEVRAIKLTEKIFQIGFFDKSVMEWRQLFPNIKEPFEGLRSKIY
jgi:hypothetical protein